MVDIKKALQLYDMMASRMEMNGYSHRQAAVYRETIAFIKTCATAEAAMDKIKGSPLYLAPSKALMQDKLAAYTRGAKENNMPEVAKVYAFQIKKIRNDINAIYEAGYHTTAMNLKVKHLEIVDAFCSIYESYFILCTVSAFDTDIITAQHEKLKANFALFKSRDVDFLEFAQMNEYRDMILSDGKGYELYLNEVMGQSASAVDYAAERERIEREAAATWEEIQSCKAEIIAMSRENLSKRANARVIAVPPNDRLRDYEFIDAEVQTYV